MNIFVGPTNNNNNKQTKCNKQERQRYLLRLNVLSCVKKTMTITVFQKPNTSPTPNPSPTPLPPYMTIL